MNEVTISSKTDNFAIEGGDLELNCTFYGIVDDGFNFTWQLPNDIIKKVHILFRNFSHSFYIDEDDR